MKKSFLLVLPLLVALSAASSRGDDHTIQQQIQEWITPVLGTQKLPGDPGCENAQIYSRPLGPGCNGYAIKIGLYEAVLYGTCDPDGDLEINPSKLAYQYTITASDFSCRQKLHYEAVLEKNVDGTLKAIRMSQYQGPNCSIHQEVSFGIICGPGASGLPLEPVPGNETIQSH